MDSVQYLLRFLFKLAILVFFVVFIWWIIAIIAPGLSPRSLFDSYTKGGTASSSSQGWLPAPKNMNTTKGTGITFLPVEQNIFNGYGNQADGKFDYITYRESGVRLAQGKTEAPVVVNYSQQALPSNSKTVTPTSTLPASQLTSAYSQQNLFVRNLSIYERGHVYTGLSFTGDARESMFLSGKFPVVIVDTTTNRAVSLTFAEATTNWTVPGWVKFKVKITGVLPNNVPCVMIFEQARAQNSKTPPTRVVMPITCN